MDVDQHVTDDKDEVLSPCNMQASVSHDQIQVQVYKIVNKWLVNLKQINQMTNQVQVIKLKFSNGFLL